VITLGLVMDGLLKELPGKMYLRKVN